ncbi:MAG: zf-TFIIB domain-containing protein [Phycisphaerales bacterium]|nr:zf-TFIIB domain-containing protein [Phycisphaerae bacterium]NNF44835.1 zf-TFIIB domain-containing protein [Phycisphaerales bacterium]NNM24800.1 zf-TFIIB domain-containing protein [Phycisphaerales bacterium]
MTEIAGETTLHCPKCQAAMRTLKTDDAIVNRCEKCFGIWLDKGERLKVLKNKSAIAGLDMAATADDVEPAATTGPITCPRCGVEMKTIKDPAQRHIELEVCPECEGNFFDAGELTDLSEFTLSERIKSLLGR